MSSARPSTVPDNNGFKKPTTLGSKARSFIPMTPRSLKSPTDHRSDFARQVVEQSGRSQDGQPPHKKFRSNAAPKGTKLASGYIDRAQQRLQEQDEGGNENKQKRLKALEEMLKLQQIDAATFEKLRDEIGVGGDTSSTHLVKGLDLKLLERARRGEDVSQAADAPEEAAVPKADVGVDVDDELEKALGKDAGPRETSMKREDTDKDVGDAQPVTTTAPVTSLSRDELLRRLKQNRKNPALSSLDAAPGPEPEPQPTLDHSRFRKLDSVPKPVKRKFTETINGRRREVLIITDKEGKMKRKTRWLDPEPDRSAQSKDSDGPDKGAWGADLPEEVLAQQKAAAGKAAKQAEDDDEDDDIFGGLQEYDPLAGINSDEEDSQKHDTILRDSEVTKEAPGDTSESVSKAGVPLKSTSTSQSRNYFATTSTTTTEADASSTKDVARDPAILAALKRAAQLRRQEEADEGAENETANQAPSSGDTARNQALLNKLQQQSRQDDVDIDMAFGGDTKDDEEDEDNGKQKLHEWTGVDEYGENDDDEGEQKGGAGKRKRGGKKRKGDKNSYGDVMSVLEGRKAKG